MPVTYRINPGERIVYLTIVGEPSFEEWEDAMLAALADPDYRAGFNFLSDRTQETDVPTAGFVRSVVDFLTEHSAEMGSYRWAAVADKPAVYGMLRMLAVFTEPTTCTSAVFINVPPARRWLLGPPG